MNPVLGRQKTILVVEDERVVAKHLRTQLSELGYRVLGTASSADEALQSASLHCPDLVLMDIRIEGERDGIETAELFRTRFGVPVVYLTAFADAETVRRAQETEAYGYLVKPVSPDALRSALEIALHKHAMERHRRELASDTASLEKSAAGLAHEINNPLTYVMANIQFALSELRAHERELGEEGWLHEIDRALDDAHGGADRVRRIVNNRDDRAREDQRTDLRRVIESALKLAQHELRGRARVITEFSPTPRVRGDEVRLGQVVLNLLINAAHALPEARTRENQIRITTGSEDDRVSIEVADNGCGMPAEVLERIFQPFFTTRSGGRGQGLGLAICRGIVTALGGEITVESTPGQGSRFRVELPIDPAEQAPRTLDPGRDPGKLLIVDDEPMVSESMRRILEPLHEVTLAGSGQKALQRIASGERFDLIVCDLIMNGMTGMDLHAELTRLDPDQARRMLFMTGGAFTSEAFEFLSSVENRCVQKPLRPGELEHTVAESLERLGHVAARAAS